MRYYADSFYLTKTFPMILDAALRAELIEMAVMCGGSSAPQHGGMRS